MNNETVNLFDELISKDGIGHVDESDCGLVRYDELPTYETFIRECFLKNRPALFTARCGLINQWPCFTEWLDKDLKQPDFDRLIELFGSMTVPVIRCSSDYGSEQDKLTMRFDEFVRLWRDAETTAGYYCKDWHLQQMVDPSHPLFYSVPEYFQSDWLNETCLADKQDDFRFVYMGGNGTHTPLHMDVLGTYSWSANICGQKRWHFTQPHAIEFIQEPGEVVFVPSEWYHHVTNIGFTISINHNWFNAFNLLRIWEHLCAVQDDIERRIDDCRSSMRDTWYEHCQLMLQANEGMNFASLYKLVHTVAHRRMRDYDHRQAKLDLWMIARLVRCMLKTTAFLSAYDFDTLPQRPKALLSDIDSFIQQAKQEHVDG